MTHRNLGFAAAVVESDLAEEVEFELRAGWLFLCFGFGGVLLQRDEKIAESFCLFTIQ
jgi:hypothetical protein